MSLKLRLGIGAALLGIGTCATALILWFGMQSVSERLDAALETETRIARYSTLSQQTATFLVIATEAIQTGLPRDARMDRLEPVAAQLTETFKQLHNDVATAVEGAAELGLDVQSRYATQSLGLARMEALLRSAINGLDADDGSPAPLRAYVDTFSSGFDPLLSQAINTEVLLRNETLAGIATLRERLTITALVIVVLTILAVAAFYFGLIRPQFRRLDQLRRAAQQIGQADFSVALPESGTDEIGQLYLETNRMAGSLLARQQDVEAEWTRLNETIADRTEALRTANRTLADIDENRRRFFADVSHELRTPLTVILMEAQIGLKETGNAAFSTIEARAGRLNRRIDDLLRVARSESGQLALDMQDHALAQIMDEVDAEVRAEADNAGMVLHISNVGPEMIRCDANWIRQVLVSLVRNALRHAREGKHIAIATTTRGDMAHVQVTDNGPGISQQDQTRVFTRFAQGTNANAMGFGVGLTLANWIVEEHGGTISIQSPLPRETALGDAPGAQIAIQLPILRTSH